VEITPQGLDQRFTPEAAACLQQVLSAAVKEMIAAEPAAVPILQRFNGVYLTDSSVITLPDVLAQVWAGTGGNTPGNEAALKIQVQLELTTGALGGPLLQDGRSNDHHSPWQTAPLPKRALRLADLGFFDVGILQELDVQQVFWLSRLMPNTAIFDAQGQRRDLLELLQAQDSGTVDIPVQLGCRHRLGCRLLATRVPQEIADQRRRRLRERAREHGRTVSQEALRLADWTFYVTNVPQDLLSLREAFILMRARWQIELLFKLWKSHGRIDEWRSAKAWRILCEVYAKLLAMMIQHWVLLLSCWRYPDRSLTKAAQTVRQHALHLASDLQCMQHLCDAIAVIQRCLTRGCRINRRKAAPHTYQLLLDPSLGGLA